MITICFSWICYNLNLKKNIELVMKERKKERSLSSIFGWILVTSTRSFLFLLLHPKKVFISMSLSSFISRFFFILFDPQIHLVKKESFFFFITFSILTLFFCFWLLWFVRPSLLVSNIFLNLFNFLIWFCLQRLWSLLLRSTMINP